MAGQYIHFSVICQYCVLMNSCILLVWAFVLGIANLAFTKDYNMFADVEGLT